MFAETNQPNLDASPPQIISEKEENEKKNNESEKRLEKLMAQNEKLSKEIESIRSQIVVVLEKGKSKKKKEDKTENKEEEDPKIKDLKQKIESQTKEMLNLQKELKSVKEKMSIKKTAERDNDIINRIKELESDLKFKESEILRLNKDKNVLEDIKKNHETVIESLKTEKEYAQKLKSFDEEIRRLKEQLRDYQRKELELEKSQRKQQEYMSIIEQRYREGCKQLGISPSLNFTRAAKYEELSSKIKKETISKKEEGLKEKKLEETYDDELPKELSEENYNLLISKYQALQSQRLVQSKSFRSQEESLLIRLKELEEENRRTEQKLKEKESLCKISISKLKELKRISKNINIATLPIDLQEKNVKGPNEIYGRKNLIKVILDTKKRKTKREIAGNYSSNIAEVIILDDQDLLNDYATNNFSILEISIFHGEKNKIFGFKAKYLIDGGIVEGHENVSKEIKNLPNTKITTWVKEEGDSLKFISGFYLDHIEYIKLESEKGMKIIVGSISGEKSKILKEFCIDIKKDDIGTVLFGGLEYKKNGTSQDLLLSFIGVEITNSSLYQKFLIRKRLESSVEKKENEIEEKIGLEDEGANISIRRGLFLSKISPIRKKY